MTVPEKEFDFTGRIVDTSIVKVYLHATFLARARYLLPFKFSIMPMVMVWITHTMDDIPIFSQLFWWQ